jgi:hypothetical protein
MRHAHLLIVCLLPMLATAMWAGTLMPLSVTVGANLETTARVKLDDVATAGGLQVTLTSNNPSQVRLSTKANEAGSASITTMVHDGFRLSPEFFVQGFANSGSVTYTASAPGQTNGEATVTLVPSCIVIGGPFGLGKASFLATTGSGPSVIIVRSVAVNLSGEYVPQPIAGGLAVDVNIVNSNETVGSIDSRPVRIAGGSDRATTRFQAATPGSSRLTPSVPAGFSVPSQFEAITAVVKLPGLGVTDGVTVGQNLQIPGALTVGAAAHKDNVTVTLTSEDPKQLLLSLTPTGQGSSAITVTIPEGTNSGRYYLQALGRSGTSCYLASAPGYSKRRGTITMVPSGLVVVGPLTLPEGQLLRPEADGGARQHGFVTRLQAGSATHLSVYTVQLDPTSHRSADISIQALRAGMSVTVDLKSTNSSVGTVGSPVTIVPGSDHAVTQFTPRATGSTVISVVTPEGFVESSNDIALKAIVTP